MMTSVKAGVLMIALLIITTAGILLLGYVCMRRIDEFAARGGMRPESERPLPFDDPPRERRESLARRAGRGLRALTGRWGAARVLALGFAAMILLGALLLQLPAASRDGRSIPFLNALFTSTSAACVTGLSVYDTFTRFTGFGQAVILLLIQVGGLGFMTVAILFSLALGRRIGLRERSLLAEAVGSDRLGGVVRLVRRILIGTAAFETAGAALLALRFVPMFGRSRGLWFAVFHSVSAFCNAGFDLMGALQPNSSLALFRGDPLVLLVIAGLIIVGGVGFVVWNDLLECGFRPRRLCLHTRAALISTAALLAGGTGLFLLLEGNGALRGMSAGERLLNAFFQSVTPRTAGFAALDNGALTDGSKLLTMFLMFVGACPGGTGGGVKATTFLAAMAAVSASVRGREDVEVFRRRLSPEVVHRAFCSMGVYLSVTMAGVFVLCAQGQSFTGAAFECFSAIGTVGLSTGITAALPALSRLALILLMFAGRVGSITVFLAVAQTGRETRLRDPVGRLLIG